jgi:beta-glucosidase
VLVFGGLNKHRYQDTENYDRKDYEMPYNQNELVEALLAVNKNIVFVNISGNSMAMPWAKKVPAILQAWYLGSETGRIIGGILAGDVNPSGKLPYTWGQKLTDYGAHALNTYPGIKRANEEIYDEEYKEGIYVGYRWIDKEKIKPLFSFGHGLSYTTFKIGKVSADKKEVSQDGQITFTVNVQNTGKRAGAEVVQLYISDLKASVDRPAKELKGFKKVYLQPGESKDVSISIRRDALSFYDETIHSWKAEAGEFEALVGNAADNICSKVKFTLR